MAKSDVIKKTASKTIKDDKTKKTTKVSVAKKPVVKKDLKTPTKTTTTKETTKTKPAASKATTKAPAVKSSITAKLKTTTAKKTTAKKSLETTKVKSTSTKIKPVVKVSKTTTNTTEKSTSTKVKSPTKITTKTPAKNAKTTKTLVKPSVTKANTIKSPSVVKPKEFSTKTKSPTKTKSTSNINKPFKNKKKNNDKNNFKNKNSKNNNFKEKIKLQKDNINKQLKSIDTGVKNGVFVYSSEMTIVEFANKINKNVSEPIKYFFNKGLMLNQNALLSEEQIGELCLAFDLDFKKEVEVTHENLLENWEVEEDVKKLKKRPPIVTIMGHVDHGKTTMLDKIRKSNVIGSEHGGITQHIGAYSINRNDGNSVTFIDTPGHAVFTQMRARGSMITDVVILVVAADDGVKPQTKEAFDHAKDADVPIIIFINKMDKPGANPDNIMSKLSEFELTPEEWGGKTPYVKGSAITGDGIDELLDTILLVSELQDLKTDPDRFASGTVLESKLDKSLGPVATLLVQTGTLKTKDVIVCGSSFGYVRNIRNSENKIIESAGPSNPVLVTGLDEVPSAGSKFLIFGDEKLAREIVEKRKVNSIINERHKQSVLTLEGLNQQIKDGKLKQIKIILKTDVNGTIEAIKHGLNKLEIPGVRLTIIRDSVGTITTTDIDLAISSKALIIGFNIRPDNNIRKKAQEDGVEILLYNVIYKLMDEIKDVAQGLLDPTEEEIILGEAQVRKLFSHSSIGVIAGCKVTSGSIKKKAKIRIIRDGKVVYTGEINNLKQGKNDVSELKKDQECGITIKKYNDIKVDDIIEAYEIKIKKTLFS